MINLQLDLESYPSDVSTFTPPPTYPPRRIFPCTSPSRIRRFAWRACARADSAENVAEAETITTEQVEEAPIPLTKDSVLKDVHDTTNVNAENSKTRHKDHVTAEKDVVPNENHDASVEEKMTKSSDEELTKPKLLNNLSKYKLFRILRNFLLDLSKPP